MDTADLMFHPVRLRIVHAMSGNDVWTTSQLAERLPDVPRTSIYRQVGLLTDGGIVEIVDERRVRGSVERSFRLRRDRTSIGEREASGLSIDDHRRGFAASMAALVAEFDHYLDSDGADPVADEVGYRQGVFCMTKKEHRELLKEIRQLVLAKTRAAQQNPRARRLPYLFSFINFPAGESRTGSLDPDT